MRKLVLAMSLLMFSAAADAGYTFLLTFPDGSIEVCPSPGFVINYPTVNVQVESCMPDSIFGNGFDK
ncbi:MAG TPA: hypothetical protein VFB32_01315 [Rudaea sp.]|nr:hypothetical protein [Rudaea sp.]